MTKATDLAQKCGIQYRHSPEGTTEMWCHDRHIEAFYHAARAEMKPDFQPHHAGAIGRAITRLEIELNVLRADSSYDAMFPAADIKALQEVMEMIERLRAMADREGK